MNPLNLISERGWRPLSDKCRPNSDDVPIGRSSMQPHEKHRVCTNTSHRGSARRLPQDVAIRATGFQVASRLQEKPCLGETVSVIYRRKSASVGTYPWIDQGGGSVSQYRCGWLWEGIICRPVGKRYQLAFGHHRLEAAKRNGVAKIKVIVDLIRPADA